MQNELKLQSSSNWYEMEARMQVGFLFLLCLFGCFFFLILKKLYDEIVNLQEMISMIININYNNIICPFPAKQPLLELKVTQWNLSVAQIWNAYAVHNFTIILCKNVAKCKWHWGNQVMVRGRSHLKIKQIQSL